VQSAQAGTEKRTQPNRETSRDWQAEETDAVHGATA
jgi:hypothetical protein